MSLVPGLGALFGAVLFGAVTWRLVSRTMKYRSYNPTVRPAHVAPEDYAAWALRRRQRERLLKVTLAAVAGAALGAIAALMVGAGLGRP